MIVIHVRNELSYDQFHSKADDLYRVEMTAQLSGQETSYPFIGHGWGDLIEIEIPQVKAVMRMIKPFNSTWIEKDDQRFKEERFFYADSNLFEVFDIELLSGDPLNALNDPNSLIITEETARKYFGNTDVVGKTLKVDFQFGGIGQVDLKVTGVAKELPEASHFHFDLLTSMQTLVAQVGAQSPFLSSLGGGNTYTYIYIPQKEDASIVENQLVNFVQTRASDQDRQFLKGLYLQPLTDIHLHSNLIGELETNGNLLYVYVFITIAILTLLIACVNFMNLATARSANRAQEVGMRKVIGALRSNLIFQFIGESLIVAFFAVIIALVMTNYFIPYLNNQAGLNITLNYSDPFIWALLIGTIIFVGLFSGSYPAFFLSGFQPIAVLKGQLSKGSSAGLLRKVLVVSQFAISTALIIGSGIILNQLDYIRTMDLGYERDWQVVIPLEMGNQNQQRERYIENLKQRYLQNPSIQSITATSTVPGGPRGLFPIRLESAPKEEVQQVTTVFTDFEHVESMGIEIIEGRNFNPQMRTDSTQSYLINEAGLRKLGLQSGDNVRIIWNANQGINPNVPEQPGTIVGVFKDMHFEPVYRQIYPMLLRIGYPQASNLIVRVDPSDVKGSLQHMENEWRSIITDHPFEYTFLDQKLAEIYEGENKLSSMVSFFTLMAVLIACLGLFGLSAFTAEQRSREIGIRKVLGASVSDILLLLSREFAFLVLIAFAVGAPLAWFGSQEWLESFFYRAGVDPWLFIGGGLLTFIIAILTVSFQSARAALSDPVEAIRAE